MIARSSVRGAGRVDGDPVSAQHVLAERERDAGADQPGDEDDGADHQGLRREHATAARAGGERASDQAAAVLAGDEQGGHDGEHDQSDERADQGALDTLTGVGAAVADDGWGDVAGAGDGERVAAAGEPRRRACRCRRPAFPRHTPRSCAPARLTWSKVPVARLWLSSRPPAQVLHIRDVIGRGGEHADLYGGRQAGQVDGADPRPVAAVGRVIAGDGVAGAGQPQPARSGRRDRARGAGGVVGVVVLHAHAVAAGDHGRRIGRGRGRCPP